MKQKAELEASFHILQSKKAAAAASKAAVYKEAEGNESGEYSHTPHVLQQPVSTTQRTSVYIQQHSKLFFKESPSEDRCQECKRGPKSSDVTLDTVLTKRYRPFKTIGTDTIVSSVASNGQKPRDQS